MNPPAAMMDDYRVELDAYNGPLDLLLFLVKRDEIDLHNIPIARLAEQYLEHLKLLKEIDVDLAGEFLVMAATLLEIKSQMLLPPREAAAEEEPSAADAVMDPRYELVQQLLAYKRYKDAASDLEDRRSEWESRFACHPSRLAARRAAEPGLEDEGNDLSPLSQAVAEAIEIDIEDASVTDLCDAFSRILASIGSAGQAGHKVVYDDTPIGLHASDIMDRLAREGPMTLQQIFVGRTRRVEMIGLFLATLELVRLKKIRVVQDRAGGEISLEARPLEEQNTPGDSAPADWRDPQTGQIDYEWPSEEVRKRAERRTHLRFLAAQRAAHGKLGQPAEGEAASTEDAVIDLDDDEPADADKHE